MESNFALNIFIGVMSFLSHQKNNDANDTKCDTTNDTKLSITLTMTT